MHISEVHKPSTLYFYFTPCFTPFRYRWRRSDVSAWDSTLVKVSLSVLDGCSSTDRVSVCKRFNTGNGTMGIPFPVFYFLQPLGRYSCTLDIWLYWRIDYEYICLSNIQFETSFLAKIRSNSRQRLSLNTQSNPTTTCVAKQPSNGFRTRTYRAGWSIWSRTAFCWHCNKTCIYA